MQSPIFSNPPETPIKTYHDTHGLLTPTVYSTVQPVTLQSIPTNSYNQTIRSNQFQSNQSYQPYQNYSINQNNVIGNLQPTRQISTVTPYQMQAGRTMQSTFFQPQPQQIVYRNYGNLQPTQTVHVVQPVQRVQQTLSPIRKTQTVIQNTVISRPQIVQTVQPEIQTIVKHQYQQQPKVQISGNSRWDSYYTGQKYYAKPPVTTSVQQPTSCHPAILGILGLLALAGLITGIVLAARAYTGYGNLQGGNTQVQGIPAGNVSTTSFTPGGIKNNGSLSTSTSSGAQIKPTYVNPITVSPYTTNVGQTSSKTNTVSSTTGTTPTYFAPTNTETTTTTSFAPVSSPTTSQTYFAPTPRSSLKTTQTTSTINSFSTSPTKPTTSIPQNKHMKLRHRLGVF